MCPPEHGTVRLPLGAMLRGEPAAVESLSDSRGRVLFWHLAVIVAGAGLFGATLGSWRSPLQAWYCALKLPLILLVTATGNGLLNGLMAALLGAPLSMARSLMAIVFSFSITSVVLAAFCPVLLFLSWQVPHHVPGATANGAAHAILLLSETAMIAVAGVAGNARLFQLLRKATGHRPLARNVLLAWLAGNFILGSQLAWIARPFVGSPSLPVEFFRKDALNGSFFESLYAALARLISS